MRDYFEHRRPRRAWLLLLLPLALWALPATSQVFRLESLIMPDQLTESHAHLENDCTSCHAETEQQSQNSLCVGCHVSVGADVESGQGFHGRHPDAGQNECASCHTDHEGREADIVGFDEATFDHSWTDMMLRSAHVMLFCSDCHALGTARNAAPNTCVGCHVQDDVHLLQMGATCNDCHNETSWQDARFDHSTTDFLLTGHHQDITCTGCHTDHVYNGVPTECASCHVEDDVHNRRNGTQCGSCHSSVDWQPQFDHVTVSQFPLLGAHESLTCESCHVQNLSVSLPTSCHGCHQSDDVHMGSLGTDCGSCHRVSSWESTGFDHDQVQGFPLLGAHANLDCSSCHVGSTNVALPTTCIGCHTPDPHAGQLGNQCGTCHVESDWVEEINFDHGLSLFPLIGMHMSIACEDCHSTLAFHDAATDCSSCHASSDIHDGRLGPQCETCHSPLDWAQWHFDHDVQTNFPLTGAHQGAACAGCHQESTSDAASAPSVCEGCHRRDDPHAGSFGADCASCHTTDSFSDVRGF